MLLTLLEIRYLTGKVVIIRLDGSSTPRYLGEPRSPGLCPTWLVRPGLPFFLRCFPLVSYIDGRRCPLEHMKFTHYFGQLRHSLHCSCTCADNPHALAF